MEELEELLRQRDATIAELERLNAEKEVRISELLSQLDKYKSVLLFAGAPGLPSGVFVAPSAIPVSRKQRGPISASHRGRPPPAHCKPWYQPTAYSVPAAAVAFAWRAWRLS